MANDKDLSDLEDDDEYDRAPAISPHGTTTARHIAAVIDNLIALVVAVVAAKQLPDSWAPNEGSAIVLAIVIVAYFGYYFVFEAALCSTPGKFMTGLVVIDFHGGRCSALQAFIRTAFRIIEVNPVIGGAPAAAQVIWCRYKQRLGDRAAGTVVVFRR